MITLVELQISKLLVVPWSPDHFRVLIKQGVRAIRFNVKRGGSAEVSQLDYFAKRVHELVGWHVELYIDSKSLSDIAKTIRHRPAVSIDHLGLSDEGFDTLLSLVDKGANYSIQIDVQ